MKKLISVIFVLSFVLASCGLFVPDTDVFAPVDTTAPDVTEGAPSDTLEVSPPVSDTADTDVAAATESDDGATTEPIEVETTDTEPAEPEQPVSEPPRGVVYMTFDDGPCKNTERVLEILEKYGIKATFFLVGKNIANFPDATRAISDAGHAIGCHSVTHGYTEIYKGYTFMRSDIEEWETIIGGVLGEIPSERLYRFPGGSTCSAIVKGRFDLLHSAVHDMGYRAFDWTFGNNDRWDGGRREGQSVEDYLKESVKVSLVLGGKPHILLMHETAGATVDTLEWTIEYLLGEGYVFDTLDNYDREYLFRR